MKNTNDPFPHSSTALVKKLIRLAFVYGYDPEIFFRRFMEAVHIDSLREFLLIDSGNREEMDGLPESQSGEIPADKLTREERELLNLIEQGFSAQELAVIYGVDNPNAVYVKRYRINKKMKGACEVEILLVVLGWLCLVLAVLSIVNGGPFR